MATSTSPGPGGWEDHGAIAISGRGERGKEYPFDRANAIDVSVVVDYTDTQTQTEPSEGEISLEEGKKGKGRGYMTFGSFWTGIWQVPLKPNLLHMDKQGEEEKRVKHLAHEPAAIHPPTKKADGLCGDTTGMHPIEGAFISYHEPWWYLWFSWGKCCHFDPEKLPRAGLEYVLLFLLAPLSIDIIYSC